MAMAVVKDNMVLPYRGYKDEPLHLSGPKTEQPVMSMSVSEIANSTKVMGLPSAQVEGSLYLAPPVKAIPTYFSLRTPVFFSHKIQEECPLSTKCCLWRVFSKCFFRVTFLVSPKYSSKDINLKSSKLP